MKNRSILSGILLLMFILTSCTGNVPAKTPIANPSAVAAVVSTMLAGIPTATPQPQSTASLTPEPPTVLPRSLYYLAQDANGKGQIFRLGRDGTTITQITFEQEGVNGFDISPVDGTIAYVVGNKLIVVEANGANNQTLVQDSNVKNLYRPMWSPVEKAIAYDNGRDVIFYSFDMEKSGVLLMGSDTENNYPVLFSPDGNKLIVRRHKIPSSPESPIFIYDFASTKLIPIIVDDKKYPCFGSVSWITSDTFFCSNHVLAGAMLSGLWRVNFVHGSIETLIGSQTPPFLLVGAPRQDADGNLYYLYGTDSGVHASGDPYPVFSLVRSDTDGQTNRVSLRSETFPVWTASWTPDGKALIILGQKGFDAPFTLSLIPVDPSLPEVELLPNMSTNIFSMEWGP